MRVTGAGVGVDSAWKQEKLKARKMLVNAAESPASSARFVGRILQGVFELRFLPCKLFFNHLLHLTIIVGRKYDQIAQEFKQQFIERLCMFKHGEMPTVIKYLHAYIR